ncbi:M50 family metallopeptidase [Paenibacillus medicaginis]|uniref:M50 family metallopeptidase n=1 Tax=Paenibacillus medicaginis TaxID=1470560 RepID=A0ABV5C7B1_9BACL
MINIRGVTFALHPLFVLIMLASVFTGHFIELITLFAIVLIHELGHAAAAALLGVKVLSIQLLPFGGVAVMEDRGCLPAWKEIVIALAGPLQNGLMILALLFLKSFLWVNNDFATYAIHGNIIIALFNLLPILPLDGGKIVQALLSLRLPYHVTLLWTLRTSILFSVLFCLYAALPLWLNTGGLQLNMLAVGIFLLYSNWVDYRNIQYRFVRFLLGRDALFYRQAVQGNFAVPIFSLPVKHLDSILRLFRRDRYHIIYVMNEHGKIIAVLPEQRIIRSYFSTHGGRT